MANETIDKLKNAGYITVTDDSQGIANKVGIPEAFPLKWLKLPDIEYTYKTGDSVPSKIGHVDIKDLELYKAKVLMYEDSERAHATSDLNTATTPIATSDGGDTGYKHSVFFALKDGTIPGSTPIYYVPGDLLLFAGGGPSITVGEKFTGYNIIFIL